MNFGIPLAWLQLSHRKSRLIIATLGVTFAVILMFVELGLRDGLFEDSVTIHKSIKADLVVLSAETDSFWRSYAKPLPRSFLYNLSAIPGVTSVMPLYLALGNFKNPATFIKRTIAVCAFRPDRAAFNLPEVNQQLAVIQKPDTFLFDRLSRPEFGPIASALQERKTVTTELSNQAIKVGGLFSLGGGVFSADGVLITSDINYSHIFNEPLEKVHFGLINIDSNIAPGIILEKISAQLPENLRVMTLQDFMELEKDYWSKATPIGFIFNTLAVISFIFGGIIVYQIIYTQISDYLHVYATLKAIGYANHYLMMTVIQEAFIMSILGYTPGFGISLKLYSFVKEATRLPLAMSLSRGLIVLFLTFAMCSIAGMLAVNKIRSADPADLF
jgi:putative ABC transport system permease protein